MHAFNTLALDENYNIVSLLRFTNLQWNRKYHQPGTFSMQLPLEQYTNDMKYIYTKDRPEVGKITQRNYLSQNGYEYIQISGYFLEHELNRHVVYKNGTTNIINSPAWIEKSGKAEDVAHAFFDAFKTISIAEYSSALGIQNEESLGRGKNSVHTRNGEYLGSKIYDILKPSGMSYRVIYDFINSVKTFGVWKGIDRTQDNIEKNNPIVFSTKYGNIRNLNILISDEEHKNACVTTHEQNTGENSTLTTRVLFNNSDNDKEFSMLSLRSSVNKKDYTETDFVTALDNEAQNELSKHVSIINMEFDATAGSYEYMKDFELGDECTIEVPEMYLSADARLIGCYEVMKSGKWSMTMEFGTPIIKGGIY